VNKSKFLALVNEYQNISPEDLEGLKAILKAYPYFQNVHALIAKGSKDNSTKYAPIRLKYAALYTTDRAVLKMIMENRLNFSEQLPSKSPPPAKPKPTEKEIKPDTSKSPASEKRPHKFSRDSLYQLYKEIDSNLHEIGISKKKFFEVADTSEIPKSNAGSDTPAESPQNSEKDQKDTGETTDDQEKKNLTDIEGEKETVILKELEEKGPREAEGEIQKAQIKIIDKFIESPPNLSELKEDEPLNPPESMDLSEQSVAEDQDLVSENLANIFLKQGKKDKAIEIYKKLIWKFPQKKAYFASRIEEIKNS